MCSSKFIASILKPPGRAEYRRNAVVACNNVIEKLLGAERYTFWETKLATALERLMWKEMSCVVFPISSKICLVAMPFEEYPQRFNNIAFSGYSNLARILTENYYMGNKDLTVVEKACINRSKFQLCWIKALNTFKDYEPEVLALMKLRNLLGWVVKWCILGKKPSRQNALFTHRRVARDMS